MAVTKKGKDYYIQYSTYKIVDGKKVRQQHQEKVGPSKQLAEAAYQKKMLEMSEQRFLGKRPSQKKSLGEFLKQYLEYSKSNKKAGMYTRDYFSAGHLAPAMGDLLLEEISPMVVEGYKAERIKRVKATTVNREL